ncbi:MAG: hypothetical protein ACHQZQ_01565 [SAR324 cluster bacterium]
MPPDAPESAFSMARLEPAALVSARSEVARAAADPDVQSCAAALARCLPAPADPELAEYEQLALLGVSAGFVERHLSPHVAAHTAIVPPLIDEIRSVYREVRRLGMPYSAEEFRLRAFHYGVHKASYLDWQLYLSKELY